MSREAFAEVARSNTMDLVTNMGEDLKSELRETLATNIENGMVSRDVAKELVDKVDGMSKGRASTIARTETSRATNLGNLYKYKDMGYKSFTVDYTGDACDLCVEEYQNKVFDIDDIDNLPPFHPNCYCVAMFHPETPEEYADKNGYEVYSSSEEPTTPEEPTTSTEPETTPTTEDNELNDLMDTLSNVSTDDLQTLIEQIAPDVTGSSGELATADLTESMEEYLNDPKGFSESYPARSNVVQSLLQQMIKNRVSNLGGA